MIERRVVKWYNSGLQNHRCRFNSYLSWIFIIYILQPGFSYIILILIIILLIMNIYSPLEQFKINPIIGLNLGWLDFSFTNSSLVMILACTLFFFLSNFSLINATIVPNRWQSIIEMIYEFIYYLIQEQIGTKGYKYFPFIFTLFTFILFCNLLGMIPYSFTATSHIVITFGLSMAIFIGVTIIGFTEHGLHFFYLLVPSGVPLGLLPLIVSIEFISYLTRGLSLGIRLTANMFAGHTLLKIISTFAWQMFMAGGLIAIGGLATVALLFALVGLEIVIAMLQAYVFTVLTCSYLNDAIHLH
jgi:ATP synthase subunit 6